MSVKDIKKWVDFLKEWRTLEEIEDKGIDLAILRDEGYKIEKKTEEVTKIILEPRRGFEVNVGTRVYPKILNLNRVWTCLDRYMEAHPELETALEALEKILEPLERKEITVSKYREKLAKKYGLTKWDWTRVLELRSERKRERGFAPRFLDNERVIYKRKKVTELIKYYRTLVYQFLCVLCVNYAEENLEARTLLELEASIYEDEQEQEKWTQIVEDALFLYMDELGYTDLLNYAEQNDLFTFGFTEPLELLPNKLIYFQSRWEVFDYRYKRLAHKHSFPLTLKWFEKKGKALMTKISARILTPSKGQPQSFVLTHTKHIWEDKGIDKPESIIVDSEELEYDPEVEVICKELWVDGAGLEYSQTKSDIVAEITPKQCLGHDCDSYVSEFNKLKSYYNLSYVSPGLHIFQSPGGNGLHFESDKHTSWNVRLASRDCEGRLRCSEIRSAGFYPFIDDVLFVAKRKGNKKLKHRRKVAPGTILSLPFSSKIPRSVYQKRRGG